MSHPRTIGGVEHVSPPQAAELAGCTVATMRRWMKRGRVPFIRLGTNRAWIPIDKLPDRQRKLPEKFADVIPQPVKLVIPPPKLNAFQLPPCPGCRSPDRGAYEREGKAVAECVLCGHNEPCPADHYLTKLLEEVGEPPITEAEAEAEIAAELEPDTSQTA